MKAFRCNRSFLHRVDRWVKKSPRFLSGSKPHDSVISVLGQKGGREHTDAEAKEKRNSGRG